LTYLRFGAPLPNSGRVSVVSTPILNDQLEARARIQNLDIDQAVREIAKINRLRPGSIDLVEEIVPLLDQAGFKEQANQIFVDASDFFLDLLQQYPDSPLLNNNYAWMCATAGRRIEFAKRHAQLAVSLMPENASYLDTLAELEFLTGNTQQAIELNRRCLQINPKIHYLRQSYRFSAK
jgi:tetratricopeptide (TPR) repeat protein